MQREKEKEQQDLMGISQAQKRMIDFLIGKKGYSFEDMDINREFCIEVSDTRFAVKADIILKVDGRNLFLIKCVMSSPESWERHSIAFGRVADSFQIPFALVTDSEHAKILDVVAGKPVSEGLDSFPDKEKARELVRSTVFSPFPEEKREKERRILYAFDAITCSATLADPSAEKR
ncbi:MAG: type I restriction enzyme HsdR N-terminal domain-containing protein [Alphaproteobacteria bacterium]|uniref:Type I restriction enzyme HsdR N-terminal domain-containing protein n=1 Tax=Candidatus Nitrobium versatile TaxID=2884831 RepID=A0A953JG06_9BACT|nr:type I restriction enzyme HsdR N-terminal domain-containing protein [Candidatus Nitrobium versatile]